LDGHLPLSFTVLPQWRPQFSTKTGTYKQTFVAPITAASGQLELSSSSSGTSATLVNSVFSLIVLWNQLKPDSPAHHPHNVSPIILQ